MKLDRLSSGWESTNCAVQKREITIIMTFKALRGIVYVPKYTSNMLTL